MVDVDALEKFMEGKTSAKVNSRWMKEIIKEIRDNRTRIKTLEDQVRKQGIVMTNDDPDFPHKEFDATMGLFDKTLASMDAMFAKVRKKRG